MTSVNRTPTTRLLALVALIVATGVLCLRGLDLFVDTAPPQTAFANPAERAITNLLDPIIGPGHFRVSVALGEPSRTMILLDETRAVQNLDNQIELIVQSILAAPDAAITITNVPFAANAKPNLSPLQLAELMGLGLLCAMLTAQLFLPLATPQSQTTIAPPETAMRRPDLRLVPEAPAAQHVTEIDTAAQLAVSDPDGTARLIRSWMGRSTDDKV